jgi:hypothetical protein
LKLGKTLATKKIPTKKNEPYRNINGAIPKLDNGGRFYNILTKADDGIISKSELGKVGGIFNDKQQMILSLELSISKLDENLQKIYLEHKPIELLPSEADSKGIIASNTIITGIPKLTKPKTEFIGFIVIPIIIGNVTTFSLIPLIDIYDVYELRDEKSSKNILVAPSKGTNKLPEKKLK